MAVKTFGSEILTSGDVNTYLANAGLVYVTSSTIGSAVSSVTVSSCFSSTYDRYKILVHSPAFSVTAGGVYISLSGITTTTQYGSFVWQSATSGTVNTSNVAGNVGLLVGLSGNQSSMFSLDNFVAQGSTGKSGDTHYASYDSSNSTGGNGAVWSTSTAIPTGFTFYPGAGTMTGGTITVYGYRKA